MTHYFNYHPHWCSGDNQSVGSSALVVSRWLGPRHTSKTFLEVASMVVTRWIVAFLRCDTYVMPNVEVLFEWVVWVIMVKTQQHSTCFLKLNLLHS